MRESARKLKSSCIGCPHLGQAGQPGVRSGKSAGASPNCTGLPECNWTRRRLAVAVGWQNP